MMRTLKDKPQVIGENMVVKALAQTAQEYAQHLGTPKHDEATAARRAIARIAERLDLTQALQQALTVPKP